VKLSQLKLETSFNSGQSETLHRNTLIPKQAYSAKVALATKAGKLWGFSSAG